MGAVLCPSIEMMAAQCSKVIFIPKVFPLRLRKSNIVYIRGNSDVKMHGRAGREDRWYFQRALW